MGMKNGKKSDLYILTEDAVEAFQAFKITFTTAPI
jgi:hypothetical protein